MVSYTTQDLIDIMKIKELADDHYDLVKDELKKLDPSHPYLTPIVKDGDIVRLPYSIPTQIKCHSGHLDGFIKYKRVIGWVLTENFRGIDVLWVSTPGFGVRLYLPTSDSSGVNITHLEPHIQGIPRTTMMGVAIRGKLVSKNLRSLEELDTESVKHMRFVAYEVIDSATPMARAMQMLWLENQGWSIPRWTLVRSADEQLLTETFHIYTAYSKYPIDNIIIAENCIPHKIENEIRVFVFRPTD